MIYNYIVLFSFKFLQKTKMKHSEIYVDKLQKENARLKKSALSNRELFRTIFNTHQAILLLIEPYSGKIIDANPAAEKFYMYSRKEFQKLKIEDINVLPPQEIEKERLKALREERNYFIFPHRIADGSIHWVEVYSSTILLKKERILFSIIHDITERRNAEIALRKSEEKFASIFRLNPSSMIISNLENGEIYNANEAFHKLIGYKKNELVGHTTLSIDMYINPDDRNKLIKILKSEGSVHNLEMNLQHRSGRQLTVLMSSEILKTSQENTIVTTIHDITELRKAEVEREHLIQQLAHDKEALKESEERYRIMGEAIDYGVWATDAKGKATHISESFCKLVGKTFEEIREFGWLNSLIPEQRREVFDLWMHSIKTGERFEHEHHIICKDGKTRIVLARGNPIRNAKGKIKSWAGINLDITDRKKFQQQLKKQNEHLTRINAVLEDFVQIAAHDLRTPISNLLNISELLKTQPDPESKIILVETIAPIAKHLKSTVDGLMETVSLQTLEKLSGQEIKFEDVWKEVQDELKSSIDSFNGKIMADFEKAPQINYIEVHLISIIRNLVLNAIKYSKQGKNPIVKIYTKHEGNYVLLAVSDNGIGIDMKSAGEDLFKPFKRFTNKAEGRGIGLYIVKNIVEKNGGHIKVESELNKGTAFYCYLKEYQNN